MPQRPDLTAVVFDLGGVLIDWNPRYLYRKIFDDEDRVTWFLETVCTHDWNEAQDAGRPFAEGVALLSDRYPEYADAIAAYDTRWEETLGGPMPDSVGLLRELDARGIPLYALTNWSAEKFPYTSRYPFMSVFRGVVVSGDEGVKKPDPAIFECLLERFDLSASTTLFIDDSLRNVRGAAAVGLHTLHFQSADQLRHDLVALGLLPPGANE